MNLFSHFPSLNGFISKPVVPPIPDVDGKIVEIIETLNRPEGVSIQALTAQYSTRHQVSLKSILAKYGDGAPGNVKRYLVNNKRFNCVGEGNNSLVSIAKVFVKSEESDKRDEGVLHPEEVGQPSEVSHSFQLNPEFDKRIKQILRFINNECGNAPNSECKLVTVASRYQEFFNEKLNTAVGSAASYLERHPDFECRRVGTEVYVKSRVDLTDMPLLKRSDLTNEQRLCGVGFLLINQEPSPTGIGSVIREVVVSGVDTFGQPKSFKVERNHHILFQQFVHGEFVCVAHFGSLVVCDKQSGRRPIQVLLWRNFKQSDSEMSACEYLKKNPSGVLSCKMRSVFGNKGYAGDIIIVDDENKKYLKGFSVDAFDHIKYSDVHEFVGDFEQLTLTKEIQTGNFSFYDGNSFTVLVPKQQADRTRHAVLDDSRWKALGSVGDSFSADLSQIFGPLSSTSSQTEVITETSQRSGDEQIAQGCVTVEVSRNLDKEPHDTVETTLVEGVEPVDVPSLEPCVDGGEPIVQDGDAVDVSRDLDEQSHDDVENTPIEGELLARVSTLEEGEDRSDKNDEDVLRGEEVKHSPDEQSHEEFDEECAFLLAFDEGVQKAGFHYNLRDIVRFHTSLKCCPFTLLGGAPGTGKSSLVTLYAKALLGNDYKNENNCKGGYLSIDVSSSWTDPEDLFGYWDMKGDYRVAASGIVPFMWDANKSGETAEEGTFLPRIICFEEMNLARVEHYFSNMIQVLSRPVSERVLKGIPSQNKEGETQCQNRAGLEVAENLRFIGTCNFDETTQAFSARFYDRCSYLELSPVENDMPFSGDIPNVEKYEAGDALKSYLNAYKTWYRADIEGCIDEDVTKMYKKIRKELKDVRVYISPRVEKQIGVYIVNRPSLLDEKNCDKVVSQMFALDEAIVQMVLPSVCGTSYPYDGNVRLTKLKDIFETEKLKLCAQFLTDRLNKFESPGIA